jgi:hypothetical protein
VGSELAGRATIAPRLRKALARGKYGRRSRNKIARPNAPSYD